MTTSEHSGTIVTPVESAPAAPGGAGTANPAALTVEQLARAVSLPVDTIRRHMEDGAPASADGTMNLIHYAAWLNQRLRELAETDGD